MYTLLLFYHIFLYQVYIILKDGDLNSFHGPVREENFDQKFAVGGNPWNTEIADLTEATSTRFLRPLKMGKLSETIYNRLEKNRKDAYR